MTTSDVKRRLSIRLTEDEMLVLVAMRQALEQSERKTVTLQAALRAAIASAFEGDTKELDFSRVGTQRDKRLELIIDDGVGSMLDALQAEKPEESHSSITLACARKVTKHVNAQLATAYARRKSDRPRV